MHYSMTLVASIFGLSTSITFNCFVTTAERKSKHTNVQAWLEVARAAVQTQGMHMSLEQTSTSGSHL